MTFRASVVVSHFELEALKTKGLRKVMRTVGNKLATRMRKRFKQAGKFKQTGQLMRSIKFRMHKSEPRGVIYPAGIRADSDGHKNRKPMSNFAVAAFLAARGENVIEVTAEDEVFLAQQIEAELAKLLGR